MNIIRYVYFYWDNMYRTKCIYRLNIYNRIFEFLDYSTGNWTISNSSPVELRSLNGKPRILEQLTELSFMSDEEAMEEINRILVMKELTS